GNIQAQSAVTPSAPTPPTTTAPTGPNAAAIAPARISPNSFEAEMARPDAALTRPRIWSGVLSWVSVPRTNTENMSAAPITTSTPSDSKRLVENPKITVPAPKTATAHSIFTPTLRSIGRMARPMATPTDPKATAARINPAPSGPACNMSRAKTGNIAVA